MKRQRFKMGCFLAMMAMGSCGLFTEENTSDERGPRVGSGDKHLGKFTLHSGDRVVNLSDKEFILTVSWSTDCVADGGCRGGGTYQQVVKSLPTTIQLTTTTGLDEAFRNGNSVSFSISSQKPDPNTYIPSDFYGRVGSHSEKRVLLYEHIGESFYRTDKTIFSGSNATGKIELADYDSFEILGDSYAKDVNNAFYGRAPIQNADVKSFEYIKNPLKDGCKFGYRNCRLAKDAQHIYLGGKVLPDIDVHTFAIMEDDFTKDATSVLFGNKVLEGLKPQDMDYLGHFYTKGDRSIYFRNEIIEGALSDSFRVLDADRIQYKGSCDYAVDEKRAYFSGTAIAGADAATFVADGHVIHQSFDGSYLLCHAKDANHTYIDSERKM